MRLASHHPKLKAEQRSDVAKIMRAYSAKRRGFLLANGTGTGKTYVYAACLGEWQARGKRCVLVIPNQELALQSAQVFREMGIQIPQIISYSDLSLNKLPKGFAADVVVWDECHKIRHMFGQSSKRGKRAIEIIKKSRFNLFCSATPFEGPVESKYLALGGLLPPKTRFDDWISSFNVSVIKTNKGYKEYRFFGGIKELKAFRQDLIERGFMSQRHYQPPKGLIEVLRPTLKVARYWQELIEKVDRRLEEASWTRLELAPLLAAQRTLLRRQLIEAAKLSAIAPLIEGELMRGQRVAVFIQSVNDRNFSSGPINTAIQEILGDLLSSIKGGMTLLLKQFPKALCYSGNESKEQLARALREFKSGRSKLIIISGSKGGTGLSLHDQSGKLPTSQIIASLPWSATELDQIVGRVVRVGLASPVRIILPQSQLPAEMLLNRVIAKRLSQLGYLVRDAPSEIEQILNDGFECNLYASNPRAMIDLFCGFETQPDQWQPRLIR